MCGGTCTFTVESETLPIQPTSSENKPIQPQTNRVSGETFNGQGTYYILVFCGLH